MLRPTDALTCGCARVLLDLLGTVLPPHGTVDRCVSTVLLDVTLSLVLAALKKVEVSLSMHREGAAPAATVSTDQLNQSFPIEMQARYLLHLGDFTWWHLTKPLSCTVGPQLYPYGKKRDPYESI